MNYYYYLPKNEPTMGRMDGTCPSTQKNISSSRRSTFLLYMADKREVQGGVVDMHDGPRRCDHDPRRHLPEGKRPRGRMEGSRGNRAEPRASRPSRDSGDGRADSGRALKDYEARNNGCYEQLPRNVGHEVRNELLSCYEARCALKSA